MRLLGFFLGLAGKGLELTIDRDVGILVEAGVWFETGFGGFSAFKNMEIMMEKADTPFDGFERVVVFQGMSLALSEFDEFTVGYAGCRPVRREVISIELKKAVMLGSVADNNMLTAFLTFFELIHGSPEGFDGVNRHEITHATSSWSGFGRERDIMVNDVAQSVHNDCFQMS